MKINYRPFITTTTFLLVFVIMTWAQNKGETSFKQICAACHTIGKGKLVGPDLANVDKRHQEEWLIKFIKSSQTVIKGGDKYADSIFKAYNQIPMPDRPDLSDEQIREIITYIKTNSSSSATADAVVDNSIGGDAKKGQELFIGNIRFANNGPTCNSCHNVNIEGYISGGVLAKDLTKSVSRLTVEGVRAVISGLVFPQMKLSYETRPLTESEIADVTAFLKHADQISTTQATSVIGNNMLIGGVAGVFVLLIAFSFFWIKRKQRTVNHSIYQRQIKSYY